MVLHGRSMHDARSGVLIVLDISLANTTRSLPFLVNSYFKILKRQEPPTAEGISKFVADLALFDCIIRFLTPDHPFLEQPAYSSSSLTQ